ncbi:MAG: hypothetical protein PHQ25_07285 [Acidobacteriota bacterium]|nr:hypothetical protein [Acidobacteriota bacterium]MDW3229599.1 hypothetical protein [Acidobacteriota bacterium]
MDFKWVKEARRLPCFKKRLIIGVVLLACLLPAAAQAQPRKYRVEKAQVRLHLDPDEKSPVVAKLPQGSILTQASAVRFRHNWVFVYYYLPEKDKTLAGYVQEPELRKLFPSFKSVLISNGSSISEPRELDFSQNYDFPLIWGMPEEKVLEVEGEPLGKEKSGETEILQYRREIMNRNCLVEYVFRKNQLTAARFYMLDNFIDNNYYISDFMKAKSYLKEQFGQPADDQVVWLDSTYKSKQEFWGQALGSGLLEFRSSWIIDETEVDLILTGSENRVALLAECISQKYKNLLSH